MWKRKVTSRSAFKILQLKQERQVPSGISIQSARVPVASGEYNADHIARSATDHQGQRQSSEDTFTALYTDPAVHGADAIVGNSGVLLALRCWTHLSFNAGSGLPLYDWSIQGDGYRVERQPSLLNDLANLIEPELIKRIAPLTSNLTSMTFIMVFPSDMMTQDLIRVVNGIKTLKHLSLRLVPGEVSKAPCYKRNLGELQLSRLGQQP